MQRHYPLTVFAPDVFDFGGLPLYFTVPIFTLVITTVAVFFACLRMNTGSVWPAVIGHGGHNSFTLAFFNDMTSETGSARYIAVEVGAGLLVAWGIVAQKKPGNSVGILHTLPIVCNQFWGVESYFINVKHY